MNVCELWEQRSYYSHWFFNKTNSTLKHSSFLRFLEVFELWRNISKLSICKTKLWKTAVPNNLNWQPLLELFTRDNSKTPWLFIKEFWKQKARGITVCRNQSLTLLENTQEILYAVPYWKGMCSSKHQTLRTAKSMKNHFWRWIFGPALKSSTYTVRFTDFFTKDETVFSLSCWLPESESL